MSVEAQRDTRRHPFRSGTHPSYRKWTVMMLLLAGLTGIGVKGHAADDKGKEKKQPPPEVVITGSVFTEKGFSLPGAEIRVRRAGERKVRWEAVSDRRGEFGVRVPQGAEYEVQVKAKGYQQETQKVDGRQSKYESLVFRMVPATGGKKP